jgi:hypothetical protein
MQTAGKRMVFYVLMVSIVILGIEAGSQILYFTHKGHFLFQRRPSEVFNIRDFSVLTNDARGFTAIPNYTNPKYGSQLSSFNSFKFREWFLSFDSFGFRRGKQPESLSGQRTIVFIGDSVPFGWGVSDDSSLPSQFFERLQKNPVSIMASAAEMAPVLSPSTAAPEARKVQELRRQTAGPQGADTVSAAENSMSFGVVNAALPSYALAQAVARYEHEIHGRMAVDAVYLQIYDPASQIALRGSHWQPSDNWMNAPYVSTSFWSRHSAFMVLAAGVASRLNMPFGGVESLVETFDPHDTATTKRVHAHVRAELERLLALSKTDGMRRLIVAPVTIPARSLEGYYSRSRLSAIELVNQDLRDFASSHNNEVIFADTISLLRRYPEAEVFLDRCCHLSERGNGLVAEYLMTLLLDSGYFSHNSVPGKM